jgi:tRNA pseudouridine55 synthase
MNAFLIIDKPEGMTSFDCVRFLRRISGERRIGFVGTLDPLATGMMIFAFGEATKLIRYLEGADKTYEVRIRLGAESDTYDAQGKIKEIRSVKMLDIEAIRRVLEEHFSGEQEQEPPMYSAVHVAGKRAYELARQGERITLKKRKVMFYAVVIKAYKWPYLDLSVRCGSGTYIRSMAHDLGKALSCGGYVQTLRRSSIGSHGLNEAAYLKSFNSANWQKYLVSIESFFKDWFKLELDEKCYRVLSNGGEVNNTFNLDAGRVLAMFKGLCVGVLLVNGQKLKFERKFNIF